MNDANKLLPAASETVFEQLTSTEWTVLQLRSVQLPGRSHPLL